MTKKTKLICSDMEGTLLFSEEASFLAYQEACSEFGYSIKYEDFVPLYGKDYKQILLELLPDLNEEYLPKIRDSFRRHQPQHYSKIKINLSIKGLLESLKDTHYIALVTNASRTNTYGILDYFSLTPLFNLIITREDVVNPKPHPEGFSKAMTTFKMDASSTLILEDSKGGYLAAKATGSQVLFVGDVHF